MAMRMRLLPLALLLLQPQRGPAYVSMWSACGQQPLPFLASLTLAAAAAVSAAAPPFPFVQWCPTVHGVRGMDPAGTFYDAFAGRWWQWVDNTAVHFSSTDLIHWHPANAPCGNGCGGWYGGTGAVSFTLYTTPR